MCVTQKIRTAISTILNKTSGRGKKRRFCQMAKDAVLVGACAEATSDGGWSVVSTTHSLGVDDLVHLSQDGGYKGSRRSRPKHRQHWDGTAQRHTDRVLAKHKHKGFSGPRHAGRSGCTLHVDFQTFNAAEWGVQMATTLAPPCNESPAASQAASVEATAVDQPPRPSLKEREGVCVQMCGPTTTKSFLVAQHSLKAPCDLGT